MNQVFIAPKIKVGFVNRKDTFTGKLAYIIYFDNKGKLRKQTSWENWRDKQIDPLEFGNEPIDGFTLNKDIKRYGGDWFSSGRTMIRVHDPRGFEFEVTTENLIGILMHTDCLRRGLIGQFVYAWSGKELVLLPTNSEDYQNAIKYTANLSKRVKAKELIPGASYKTKRKGDVIFIGKFNWYTYNNKGLRKEIKSLVFTNNNGKTFFKKTSLDFLSEVNNTEPVNNYAELVDKFNSNFYAKKIIKYEMRPVEFKETTTINQWSERILIDPIYFFESQTPNLFLNQSISVTRKGDYGFEISDSFGYYGHGTGIRIPDGEIVELHRDTGCNYRYNSYYQQKYSLEKIKTYKLYHLYITFENGEEKQIISIQDLNRE